MQLIPLHAVFYYERTNINCFIPNLHRGRDDIRIIVVPFIRAVVSDNLTLLQYLGERGKSRSLQLSVPMRKAVPHSAGIQLNVAKVFSCYLIADAVEEVNDLRSQIPAIPGGFLELLPGESRNRLNLGHFAEVCPYRVQNVAMVFGLLIIFEYRLPRGDGFLRLLGRRGLPRPRQIPLLLLRLARSREGPPAVRSGSG